MADGDTTIAAVVSIIGCLTGLVTAFSCFYKPFTKNCGYLMDRESNHTDLRIQINDVKEVETSEGYSKSLKSRVQELVKDMEDMKIDEKINKKCLFVVPDICSRFYIARRIGKTLVLAKQLSEEKIKEKNKSSDEVPPQAQEAKPKVEDKLENTETDEVPPQALEAWEAQPKVEDKEITEMNKSIDEGPAQAHVAQPKEKDAQNVKLTGEQESKPIEDDAEKNKPTDDADFISLEAQPKCITEMNKSTDEVPPQALEAQNTQPQVEDKLDITERNKSINEVPPQELEAREAQPKVEDKEITERNKSTEEVPPQALEAQNTQPKVEDKEITEINKLIDEGPAQAHVAQPKEKDAQNVKLTGKQESKPIEDDAEKNKPTLEVLPEDAQKGRAVMEYNSKGTSKMEPNNSSGKLQIIVDTFDKGLQ